MLYCNWSLNMGKDAMDPWEDCSGPKVRPLHIEQLLLVDNNFNNCSLTMLLGLGHQIEWPPRSPNLTPCDFLLCGYLKDRIYKISSCTIEENNMWNTSSEMHWNDKMCYALNGRKGQTGHCCLGAASELHTVHHLCYADWHSVVEWIGWQLIFFYNTCYIWYTIVNKTITLFRSILIYLAW